MPIRTFALYCIIAASSIPACKANNTVHFSVDFRYPSMGVGPNAHLGTIVLEPGKEDQVVALALVEALQGMEFNVSPPATPRTKSQSFTTDTAPLSGTVVDAYNREFGQGAMALPAGPVYGLKYEVGYSIENERCNFAVTPFLYHRSWGGASGADKWRPYNRNYSNLFFATLLRSRFVTALKSNP